MADTPTIPRALLEQAFPGQPRLVYEFEDLSRAVADTADTAQAQVAATQALQDATVVTLSANDALTNERILTRGRGIRMTIDEGTVTLGADVSTQGGIVRLTATGDSDLTVPQSGTIATLEGDELLEAKTLDRLRVTGAASASAGMATHRVQVTIGGVAYWMLLQAV